MQQVRGHHAQEARSPQRDQAHSPALRVPWRVLLLDRSPDDPKCVLASITLDSDVQPAELDAAGRYLDWDAITRWVEAQIGGRVALVPVHDPLAWRVDEGGRPR